MKTILRIEELGMFSLAIFLFAQTGFSWWWLPAFILLPDIGMIGYAVNAKVGSAIYNLCHHKAVAVGLYIMGYMLGMPSFELIGLILFGHASLDRIFGYGFKYADSFRHTHLGAIGVK